MKNLKPFFSKFKILLILLLVVFTTKTILAQTCTNFAYQTIESGGVRLLNTYNIVTGATVSSKEITGIGPTDQINAIGWNTYTNTIWGSILVTNKIVSIDPITAVGTVYTIPNLFDDNYITGEVVDGYLYLWGTNWPTGIRIIDVNPARTATYLKIVDFNTKLEATSPYFTPVSAPSGYVADFVYDASTNSLIGMYGTASAAAYSLLSLNLSTGSSSISSSITAPFTGLPSTASFFGAIYKDASGSVYVFSNDTGGFYKLNLTSLTATLVSTNISSFQNDGTSCPNAILFCNAGSAQVPLTGGTLANTCPATTANLNSLFTGTAPSGSSLVWFNNNAHTGTALTTAQAVAATAGTYYAFFYDAANNCYNTATSTASAVVSINSCVIPAAGTIDCAKTQIIPAPVAGTAKQVDLMVTVNVTTAGCFTPITVSGSGMSIANGATQVCTTATGVQQLHIPLNYDGTALGTMNFSIGSAGSCSADLTKVPKKAITDIWTLDCVPTEAPELK